MKDLEELCSLGLQKYRSAIISLLKAKKKNDFINDVETTAAHYRTEGQRNCELYLNTVKT